jgi:hypothetical protein
MCKTNIGAGMSMFIIIIRGSVRISTTLVRMCNNAAVSEYQ